MDTLHYLGRAEALHIGRGRLVAVVDLRKGGAQLLVLLRLGRAGQAVAYLQHVPMAESPALALVSAWGIRTVCAQGPIR